MHIAQEGFFHKNRNEIVTIGTDVKQHYPDTDWNTAATALKETAPELLRLHKFLANSSIISTSQHSSSKTDILTRTNGLGQGWPGSSAIAGSVVALLAKKVYNALQVFYKEHNLNQDTTLLSVTACHDNIVVHVHSSAAYFALEQLRSTAASLYYRLSDWEIYLHGNSENRSVLANALHIQHLSEPLFDPDQNIIKRPDITGKKEDLLVLMGVPIYTPFEYKAAADFFRNAATGYREYVNELFKLHDMALYTGHGEHHQFAPSTTATQMVFTALRSTSSFYHHFLKGQNMLSNILINQ